VKRRRHASKMKDISLERIQNLFDLAEAMHSLHPERSDRYVEIARSISTRQRVRIPRELKKLFCKGCGSYLGPRNKRVRLREGFLTVTCVLCGRHMRYPYRKKVTLEPVA
jgi:ribonuclease P protein subunit RPR2